METKNIGFIWSKSSPTSKSIYSQITSNEYLYNLIEVCEYEQNMDSWDEILPPNACIPSIVYKLPDEEMLRQNKRYVCYSGNECIQFLNQYINSNIKDTITSSPDKVKPVEQTINYNNYGSTKKENNDNKKELFERHFNLLSEENVRQLPKFIRENYHLQPKTFGGKIGAVKNIDLKKMSKEITTDFIKKDKTYYISKPEKDIKSDTL